MSLKPTSLSIPGKAFLLGEYAVLAGAPALLAAVGPRFELYEDASALDFFPDGPAGKLMRWVRERGGEVRGRFLDPHEGRGGLGASTAQFALTHAKCEGGGVAAAWALYRELTASAPISPSGADLVAQILGGLSVFQCEGARLSRAETKRGTPFDDACITIFSATEQAGRKVATHEHLRSLTDMHALARLRERLEPALISGLRALERGDAFAFGYSLSNYGDALVAEGLEHPATTEDRAALMNLPGVLGVKGSGALQADALVAAVSARAVDSLIEAAEKRGLRLVERNAGNEPGLSS